jgi:Ca-activated chloride channel homolog
MTVKSFVRIGFFFGFLCLFCLFPVKEFSQTPTPTVTQTETPTPIPPVPDDSDEKPITSNTDLVTLTLTVTDQYSRYFSGLMKKNFTVTDNGVEQDLTFFSDTDAPVSIGILFDVSGSMSGEKIRRARQALEKFLNTSHPMDEYFLIAFNSKAQLLLDRSRDGEAVLRKLTLVQPKNNTALYDAVYLGVERVTRGTHQKKAVLIISDGEDNNSRYKFTEVRRICKESDVNIYSIGLYDGSDANGQGIQGQSFLTELSSVTGGEAFFPQTNVEMDEIFERIALELRHQYSVGYTPKNFTPDGKWRKVKVKVKPPRGLPRLTVRSREGYYATPNINLK